MAGSLREEISRWVFQSFLRWNYLDNRTPPLLHYTFMSPFLHDLDFGIIVSSLGFNVCEPQSISVPRISLRITPAQRYKYEAQKSDENNVAQGHMKF